MLRTKTFEELVNSLPNGLEDVFEGTNADEATQESFLEWLFDYRLCAEDNVFLRYFRRRFNNLYPRYLEQLRILSIRDNFDPYVTEYFQDVTNRNGQANDTATHTIEVEGETGTTESGTNENTTTRTPNLTTTNVLAETTVDDADTVTNGTSSMDKTGTDEVTGSGSSSLRKTGTETTASSGTSQMLRTGTDTTETTSENDSTTDAKSDAFGIAYPESNLGSLNVNAQGINSRNIDYANSETIGNTYTTNHEEGEGSSTVTHDTADNGSTSDNTTKTYNTTDTDTTSDTKTTEYDTNESGTTNETTAYDNETTHNANGTVTETGTETTAVEGETSKTSSSTNTSTTTQSEEGTKTNLETVNSEHKGRTESVADIIPRAVKAIINTNELMWFIDAMKVCFDCTDCY